MPVGLLLFKFHPQSELVLLIDYNSLVSYIPTRPHTRSLFWQVESFMRIPWILVKDPQGFLIYLSRL